MKLEDWLARQDVDSVTTGLTVISHCGDCKYWSDDLNFCNTRNQINWAEDDGCIKWEAKEGGARPRKRSSFIHKNPRNNDWPVDY